MIMFNITRVQLKIKEMTQIMRKSLNYLTNHYKNNLASSWMTNLKIPNKNFAFRLLISTLPLLIESVLIVNTLRRNQIIHM